MRDRTEELLETLDWKRGERVVDLTCGTGYATQRILERTGGRVTGVDQSKGMLDSAKTNYGETIEWVQSDALAYLCGLPARSADCITCCWGLGYTRPLRVLREFKRVLKPGGTVGIIDNSLFSLWEVLYCSCLAFLESPESLHNVMRFRFLAGRTQLGLWFRLAGLKPKKLWDGQKSYAVRGGQEAIERLRATGAAAGFEYAASPENEERIFRRFAEILEEKYARSGQIEIHHRYFGGIALK